MRTPQTSNTPAFTFIHRSLDDTEIYFVANPAAASAIYPCTFRIGDRQPELWYPDTGKMVCPALYAQKDGNTTLHLYLDPCGSVFVVFRSPAVPAGDRIVKVTRDGREVPGTRMDFANQSENVDSPNNFTMELWALPEGEIALPSEAAAGMSGMSGRSLRLKVKYADFA